VTRTTFYFKSVLRRLCNSRAMTSTCCWNNIRLSQYAACAAEQLSSEHTLNRNMGRKKKKQSKPWCWYPFFFYRYYYDCFHFLFYRISLFVNAPGLLLIKIIYYVFFNVRTLLSIHYICTSTYFESWVYCN